MRSDCADLGNQAVENDRYRFPVTPPTRTATFAPSLCFALGDKSCLHRTDGLKKLVHVGGSLVDVGIQGVHDRPRERWVDRGAPLDEVGRFGCVVLQRRPAIENGVLPGVLESAEAVAGHPERENIDSFIGISAADDLGRHVKRRAGSIAGTHERSGGGDGESKVDQLDPCGIGKADEVPGADIAMNEILGVDILQCFGHVSNQRHSFACHMVFLAVDHDILHAWPGDIFHDDDGLPLGRNAHFVRLNDLGMTHGHRDLALAWLAESFEAVFEQLHFFDVQDFDPDEPLTVLVVFADEKVGHRTGHPSTLSRESGLDIDFCSGSKFRLKCIEEAHASDRKGETSFLSDETMSPDLLSTVIDHPSDLCFQILSDHDSIDIAVFE